MCRCKHLVGMAVDLDVTPDLDDPAVGADQNRCTKYALEDFAIHGFFAPDAVRLQQDPDAVLARPLSLASYPVATAIRFTYFENRLFFNGLAGYALWAIRYCRNRSK
jgi:hypothetical protein